MRHSQEEKMMNIGIIGAGSIGATLARLFAEAGHYVAISNSRGPESLADVIRELGPNIKAMTVADAASFGDVVVEAIPFGRYQTLPVEQLVDKILVSAANYYPGRDGQIELGGRAQSELIAEHLPTTKVVKAFNTIWYQHLGSQGNSELPVGERRVIFLAGDDLEAKEIVAELITEIGFGPLDIGSLAESKAQEPGTKIYNVDMTVNEAQALLRK
jgi:predicted dinucleotide-binding enzyme